MFEMWDIRFNLRANRRLLFDIGWIIDGFPNPSQRKVAVEMNVDREQNELFQALEEIRSKVQIAADTVDSKFQVSLLFKNKMLRLHPALVTNPTLGNNEIDLNLIFL